MEGFPSGQREQTVNLPSSTSKVRILPPPPSLSKVRELSNESAIKYSAHAGKDEKLRLRFDSSAARKRCRRQRPEGRGATHRVILPPTRSSLFNSPCPVSSPDDASLIRPTNAKKPCSLSRVLNLVGDRGFEPPTPSSRTKCATRLRQSPNAGRILLRRYALVNPLIAKCLLIGEKVSRPLS